MLKVISVLRIEIVFSIKLTPICTPTEQGSAWMTMANNKRKKERRSEGTRLADPRGARERQKNKREKRQQQKVHSQGGKKEVRTRGRGKKGRRKQHQQKREREQRVAARHPSDH